MSEPDPDQPGHPPVPPGGGAHPLVPGAGVPLVAGPPASVLDGPPRPARFLLGRRNLLGLGLALVGVVVAFTGLLGPFWPIAVVGLYAAGFMLAPRLGGGATASRPAAAADLGDIRHAMTTLVRDASGRLPAEVMATVARIENLVLSMLPRVEHLPPGSEDVYILRATALDYLPATLESYLSLPSNYASQQRLSDGNTAETDILAQLALLESKLTEVSEDIARSDGDRLLANGRFLREKFGRSELAAPLPGGEASP